MKKLKGLGGRGPRAVAAIADEEFVGPFSTWLNAKTGYGATADGVADDTAELQAALDALSASTPVLYLPAGTYKISATLTLTAAINISIIGEDPATTKILWAGGADDVMLYLNGVAYSRINRLTFDGASIANTIGVDQNYDGVGNYFDTGNEYADDVFMDLETGIRGGFGDFGFAETTVIRNAFYGVDVGIALGNFNALDLFVWYSRFEDCVYGVATATQAVSGAGNFNVFNSVFKRSTYSDVLASTTGSFSFRDNYSINSDKFATLGGGSNPSTLTLQRNTILDPVCTADFGEPIWTGNFGPIFLIDNTVRSLESITNQKVVTLASTSDLFSIGNEYTSSNYYAGMTARSHSISDSTVTRASITTAEPTLPSTPPNLNRTIYNIAPGSSAATIQSTINTAAATSRSVVHLPPGTLNIDTTLTIPSGADLQIIGDGAESKLNWTGTGDVLMQFASPARAILRDFAIVGAGIVVDDCDQPGSRVFMDQPYLQNYEKNLVVNTLDYTNVQIRSLYHSGYGAPVLTSPSIQVNSGSANGGQVNVFGGASSDAVVSYDISGTAHVNIQDVWYESSSFSRWMTMTGGGYLSQSGFRIATQASPGPAIALTAMTGKVALMGSTIDGNVTLSGSASGGKVLVAGYVAVADAFLSDTTSPADTMLQINCQSKESPPVGDASEQIPEVGSYDADLITELLAEYRALSFANIGAIALGKTDLRLYRVQVGQALTGITLN